MAKKATPKTASKSAPAAKPTGATSDFAALAKGLDSAWSESREKEPQARGFAPADIPDGDYVVQLVGARVGVYKTGDRKGTPYVRFRYQIVVGQYENEVVNSSDDLSADPAGNTGRSKLDYFTERLQRMGVETKKLELAKLPQLCAFLIDPKNPDGKPFFRAAVKNDHITGKNGEPMHFQKIYINEGIHPDDVDAMKSA